VPINDVDAALRLVRDLVRKGLASAVHDVSDGGLACALAEMAIAAEAGLEVDLDALVELRGGSGETNLFGEGAGGIVLAAAESKELLDRAEAAGVEAVELGSVGGDRISIAAAERDVSVAVADAERAWRSLAERI
jgi:phosphoribosylformylglycinamidine synthase subunit PurL